MSQLYEISLTCPKSLEGLLVEEASQLGLQNVRERVAVVQGQGDLETAYRLCLWSRLANRVLLVINKFDAPDAESLYQQVYQMDWADHLTSQSSMAIEFSGKGAGIDNTHFGALKVKDAIVDRLRDRLGNRPSIEKRNPDLRINVHVQRNSVVVSLDLSGASLHQRGYRLQQGAAPLKENLAAAVLIRAGWAELAKQGAALTDPMCGVGTFLIEGAMIAADIAPNLKREHWGFSHWQGHIPSIWSRLLDEAQQRAAAGLKGPANWIRGYEADPRLIQPARNNIERAGLAEWVKIYQGELATFEPHPDKNQTGLVVCNPPYGERLGDEASLLYLYQHLGDRLRQHCLHWQAAVFTGAPQLGKRMGLRSHKQYALFNGALPCKLLLFKVETEFFVTGDNAAAKTDKMIADALAPARLSEGAQMFANRLKKNLKALSKWVKKQNIECYRLYDADMPEYAVAIDVYGQQVHVQEYAPPKSIDENKAQARFLDVIAAIPSVLLVKPEHIAIKRRERQSGLRQYEKQAQKAEFLTVQEHGAKLLVNLTDYLDTGLFLDHRPMRLLIQQQAAGKRFLNLFCYTASVSVHAAVGGARTSTSVDLSKTYLDWARRNLSLNGFSDKHRLEQADVMQWIAQDRGEYDLIFIDPPTFSNSKRMDGVFDVQRDHVKLLDCAMQRLSNDGVLYFSNNFRRFELDAELSERYVIEEITQQTLDPDFKRNSKIHRAWRISHRV